MSQSADNDRTSAPAVIPILMYHNISPLPAGITRYKALYVRPRTFARQMWLLRRMGYTGLSMSAAMSYLRGEKQGKAAVITLDDGYRDNFEHALPVLREHGFSATCYVVSDHVGQHNVWDSDKLGIEKPLMSAAQLREWHRGGMEVGAHTRTHPRLSECGGKHLDNEIRGGKQALEDIVGAPVSQFCYPYGDFNERALDCVAESGFDAATTTRRGRARVGMDMRLLPRIPVALRHLLPSFAVRVMTGYEDRNGRNR
ncbi:MAG: polysaccharide deacetylase family protein [Xanthomonadaceae bacterium]|jgi:peptidoglycan/xylan/chitin deacetylase (PgdA/CDA1 family)|nr:polysaccharide deacetylase family protein [Xanthomonadaceae bacterium]